MVDQLSAYISSCVPRIGMLTYDLPAVGKTGLTFEFAGEPDYIGHETGYTSQAKLNFMVSGSAEWRSDWLPFFMWRKHHDEYTLTFSSLNPPSGLLTLGQGGVLTPTSPLADAIEDLDGALEEAAELEFPVPSDLALSSAKLLLPRMFDMLPRRFEVYPTPDGEIAIDAPFDGGSVLLLCRPDGRVMCMVNDHGNHRRMRYESSDDLPDRFIREALLGMANGSGQ